MSEYEITFLPSGQQVRAASGSTLIEAVRGAGLPMASACDGDGLCARCGVHVVDGGDSLAPESDREQRAKQANRVDPALRLACRVRVNDDLTVKAPYW